MTETDVVAMSTPQGWDDAPRPKRNGSRGLLPSTWLGRPVRLAYAGADGKAVETSGTLLDWCGTGPVFDLAGGKVIVAWEKLHSLELVGD